jgi:hypothetical protein
LGFGVQGLCSGLRVSDKKGQVLNLTRLGFRVCVVRFGILVCNLGLTVTMFGLRIKDFGVLGCKVQPVSVKIAEPEAFRAFHLQFVSRRGLAVRVI